ncbi:MAG: hypothetical protein OXR68_00440 [Alphaproteobacteria bacterium]|nr:hypothetical protein [Alphaproteobacteria bacterium]MDD9919079.1 hypothetical protein [Alphaproteobacteria bacterium]
MTGWNTLLSTLDTMHTHAKSDTPQAAAQLEQTIIRLGQVAKDLQGTPPPDQATYLRLHAAINKLGQVLPAERATIRKKITGLVNRAMAQQAYKKMSTSK